MFFNILFVCILYNKIVYNCYSHVFDFLCLKYIIILHYNTREKKTIDN